MNNIKRSVRDFGHGMAFGIAQVVPGVSGGTIAIILGFYDRLIETANHFTGNIKKHLRFLLFFGLGMVGGLLLLSELVNFLLTHYSFPTMCLFVGMIAGIIPLIYKKVQEPGGGLSVGSLILTILPIIALVVMSHLSTETVTPPAEIIAGIDARYMLFLFVVGMIAAASLVLPGFSGSFVLLVAGVFHVATYTLSSVRLLLADITNLDLMLSIAAVMLPLGLGIVVGALAMARFVEKLLLHHAKILYAVILGLLVGSVYALFREPIVFQSGISAPIAVMGAGAFGLGAIVSYHLGKRRL